ncbi:hypothetical protein DOY81_000962 [Sarcophaga bullata]|nr:hypothetical protein DOY81_000962 [Sarcophaga bullata]
MGIYHKFYKCPNCQEGFSAVQKLEKHLSNNSSQCNVAFECPQCLKSFKSLISILRHKHDGEDKELQLLKTILPQPQYVGNLGGNEMQTLKDNLDFNTCNLCSLQFSCKILLKQHKKRHEDLSKYKCFECKQSYATKCSLKIHFKSHKKDGARARTYKCIYCDNKFTTAQNCRSHMLTHLKQLIKTPTASLDNNAALNRIPIILKNSHEDKTLTTETYFIKNIKGQKIAQDKSIGDQHGLQYKCCECGKSFRYQAWLTKHFNYKHSTEYSYKCLECSRKFRTKQTLKTHMVTHKKDRDKFNCQVCARQYASKKSLRLHLRIHTEEKPFKCKKVL